jgi:biotin carboxyl carrier protein
MSIEATRLLIRRQITSRYDGVIKRIHYEAEEMAQVGKVIISFSG